MCYSIEESNYRNDPRVLAARKWYDTFNEATMTAFVDLIDGEGPRPVVCTYKVCPTCNGAGQHTNPSIDAGGISTREFDADLDFLEDYLNGVFNVTCYGCGGKRVVPVPTTKPEWLKSYLNDFTRSHGELA